VTNDAIDKTLNGSGDAFVASVSQTGSLLFASYLGGSALDSCGSIVLDGAGNLYLAGATASPDFPVTAGAFDTMYNGGGSDAFVMKLNSSIPTPLPDLELGPPDITFNPPSPVETGNPLTVSADVHNLGDADASSVLVRFFDGPPSMSNRIGPDNVIPFIPHGGAFPTSIVWTAEPPGVHLICAVADPASTILELNESNNQACDQIEVITPPIPDLSVSPSDVGFSPPSPFTEGSAVEINATIHNIGGNASEPTATRFYDGLPPLLQIGADQPLPSIPIGGSANVSVMWIASPPGGHEICVVADPDDLVAEIDETNNMACVSVKVFSLPDLVPHDLDITPSSPVSEGTISRINMTITNEGDVAAGAFDVLLFDDKNGNKNPDAGEHINVSSSSGIGGHSQSEFIFDWNATPAGSHRMCAYADPPPKTVIESNETNNVACIDVLVQPGPVLRPDYVPVYPRPPLPIKVGKSSQVYFSVQVLNQGNGTATDNTIIAFSQQSSPPFATFVLSPLAPATNSSRFTATWTSPAIPGICSVSVDVDYDNKVSEWDETNNEYTWTVDVVTGPITSLVVGYPNYTSPAAVTYVKSTTPLSLAVLDQSGLGIRNTTYTIDGGNPVNYTATGTFFLAVEGVRKIEWQSLDWAGNLEDVSSMNLTVDNAPPATTITQSDMQATTETVFNLTATDSGCGVKVTWYRIDGGSRAVYSGGFTLPEGEHNISYNSNDMLNNTEAEKWLVVTVEGTTTPPEVAVNYKPLVAVIFAIILMVAGLWSSKRRPWKDGKDKMAVMKAFAITSLPFVLGEAATGVISLLTGQLSIPPAIGPGTALDLVILVAGLAVQGFTVFRRGRRPVQRA
jgi:subtilase family serine protease